MKTSIKLITPEYAEKLLEKNNINRNMSRHSVNEYARQMAAGLWFEETGEAIKIAYDGTLIDGQQRLMAIIKAGVSLNFLVIEEMDKTAFRYIDTGKKRTAGDVLTIAGVAGANHVAAGIKRYLALKAGIAISYKGSGGRMRSYSSAEILSIYTARIEFWKAASLMCRGWYEHCGRILHQSDILAFYAFFFDINKDDAFSFMEMLAEGTDLTANHPVRLLRNKLLESKLNTRFNLSGTVKTALVIKAWNFYRKGEFPKLLKYAPEIHSFPVAI